MAKIAGVDEDQLRSDGLELADHLIAGRGMEALEVIYGGAYGDPASKAELLHRAAAVARYRANTHPR